jgi:hypothetical protein
MQTEIHRNQDGTSSVRSRRAPRPWLQLVSAVLKLAGEHAQLLSHSEAAWASITFTGTRHVIRLRFEGDAGAADAEAFIDAMAEHEFTLSGKLVADATIAMVEHTQVPEPSLIVEAELLVIDDS